MSKTQRTMRICEECGDRVKLKNYPRHMREVHGRNPDGSVRSKNVNVLMISIVLILIVGGISTFAMISRSSTPATPTIPTSSGGTTSPPVLAGDGSIRVSTSEVDSSAKWYTYSSGGVNIRYFLVKGGDGKPHLAADACDVCYAQKRGYRQTGAVMTCNNCGQTFAINSIGTENQTGGCWPSYIPMKVEDGYVVIRTSDLDKKRPMFI